MHKFLLSLLIVSPAFSALTVTVTNVVGTNATLQERGTTGPCTILVSTDPTFTSPVTIPDFNGTVYTNSSTDTGRADTVTWPDGTVNVLAGHNTLDRSLSVNTSYYYQVSGCGGTATGSFTTTTIGVGTSQPFSIPFNSSNIWNYANPPINLLAHQWVTDPITGVQIQLLNIEPDRGWRTGGQTSGLYTAFQNWVNNSWTGLPALTSPFPTSSSTVTTSGTTALDLYGIYNRFQSNPDAPFYGVSFDDLGVVLWGSATNSSGTNNQIALCIFTSPVAGCLGTPFNVTLLGSYGQISGSTNDADNALPGPGANQFPSPFFKGWGLTAPLGPDYVNTSGTLNAVSGVLTISGVSQYSNFPNTMVAGQKIYIAGSSPTCTNNLCTMATGGYANAGQVTINENLTISGAAYIVYMWGLRIQKVTSTGSVTVGAAFKWAGSLGLGQQNATYPVFNPNGFTANGHYGFLLETPPYTNGGGNSTMYFASGDGYVVNLWNQNIWGSSSCYASANAADLPNSYQTVFSGQASPDATDPRTWYVTSTTGIGGTGPIALFKIKYNGTTAGNFSTNYGFDQVGDGFIIVNPPCGDWVITNLTPASTSPPLDVPDQIVNSWSSVYNTSLYGNSWSFVGVTDGYAVFSNVYGGQNNACWIALVNTATGLIDKSPIHTLDGTGTTSYYNGIRFGGCHNLLASAFTPAVIIDNNGLSANNSSVLFGGPFEFTPSAILEADGVTWNTNTCLDWPISGGSGFCGSESYYSTCSAGNPYIYVGASTPNCVTFKIPTGGDCNINPGATEKAAVPACLWNASYTQGPALQPGDNFVQNQSDSGDQEHFRVLSITTISGALQLIAQRNAVPDYCAYNPTYLPGSTINNGMQTASQLMHANGWVAVMNPVRINGCNTGQFFLNPITGAIQENGWYLSTNHGELTPGFSSPNLSYLNSNAIKVNLPFTSLFTLPTTFYTLAGPTFQGVNAGIGSGQVQSYFQAPGIFPWGTDANALNGNYGSGPELTNNNIGSRTLTHISGNVYTITLTGVTASATAYKNFPLIGWAGRYILQDISGSSSLVDSTPWSMCYVYNAGECHAGSTVNTIYVNVPGVYDTGTCLTGQSFLINPCVVAGLPGGGGVRQQNITSSDLTGQGSRVLSYLLTSPGELYPYSRFVSSPDGTFGVTAAHHIPGWTLAESMIKLPPWTTDSVNRTIANSLILQVPSGPNYVRVAFGYSRYVGPNISPVNHLYCTPRTEECLTSSTVLPFAFENSDSSATSCGSGCIIKVPWVAGNSGWYRIDRSANNVTWTLGVTVPIASP